MAVVRDEHEQMLAWVSIGRQALVAKSWFCVKSQLGQFIALYCFTGTCACWLCLPRQEVFPNCCVPSWNTTGFQSSRPNFVVCD